MKIVGVILLVLQVIAIIGGILNGALPGMLENGEIVQLIGFFIIGIIGAVLLTVGVKKGKKKKKDK